MDFVASRRWSDFVMEKKKKFSFGVGIDRENVIRAEEVRTEKRKQKKKKNARVFYSFSISAFKKDVTIESAQKMKQIKRLKSFTEGR